MLTTPLKIGFAAACLVAVAIWIAVDQSSLRREDAPLSVSATPQAVLPPPMVAAGTIVPGRSDAPVICPSPAAPPAEVPTAKAEAAAPKPEVEKPAAPVQPKKCLIETLPGGQRMYTVVQGDTLYGISVKVYNTPRHYERIYDANQERISDPNTLQIGMKLVLPDHAAGVDTKTANP
ncbi:MAG TPA: LysM peptidoglycan-binding domain-containing protein [Planctomycetota bacterium]|jgi:nucleoid-associated protein YgaU|nr:LysM peptidoglycan-binding domain-containing protein [Planctomycetota bacterium]